MQTLQVLRANATSASSTIIDGAIDHTFLVKVESKRENGSKLLSDLFQQLIMK